METWIWRLLPVVVLIAQGLGMWFLWSLSRQFVTCDTCAARRAEDEKSCAAKRADYEKRLGGIAAEGQELRASLATLATADDLNELAVKVEEVNGGQKALCASVKALGISIDRLDKPIQLLLEHHINGERE